VKRRHFDALEPVCPRCKRETKIDAPLVLDRIDQSDGDDIIEGSLACSVATCRQEYPIIDGIPVLVPDVRSWVLNHQWDLLARRDLSPMSESLVGDCLDPGSPFNVSRQHISIYGADHYGTGKQNSKDVQAGVHDLLQTGIAGLKFVPDGPILDLGCSVGGTSFALADADPGRLVIGMDLSWGMLRIGRDALTDGKVTYGLREIGLVYRRIQRAVDSRYGHLVDFWIGDALWPPFAQESFGLVVALNLLDCVTSPPQALSAIDGLLKINGRCLLATPFDWSVSATPIEGWIGGHSQRGDDGGSPEMRLRALLADGKSPLPGLRLSCDSVQTLPWRVRIHGRCTMEYATDLFTLSAQ
jgi:SAM-dependent methyltransferase/uncharacterized protein YbaR (Trm112 family)